MLMTVRASTNITRAPSQAIIPPRAGPSGGGAGELFSGKAESDKGILMMCNCVALLLGAARAVLHQVLLAVAGEDLFSCKRNGSVVWESLLPVAM